MGAESQERRAVGREAHAVALLVVGEDHLLGVEALERADEQLVVPASRAAQLLRVCDLARRLEDLEDLGLE